MYIKLKPTLILILIATEAFSQSSSSLRKYEDGQRNSQARILQSEPVPELNAALSTSLVNMKSIGAAKKGTYQAIKGTIVVALFGSLGVWVNYKLNPRLAMADINKAGLGIVASGAMLTWGTKELINGVTHYLYETYDAANSKNIVVKGSWNN